MAPADGSGEFVEDFCRWGDIPQYRAVVEASGMGRAAAELMGTGEVRLFHDHMLGDLSLDALCELLDQLRREEARQEDGPVALERGNLLGGRDAGGHQVFPGEPQMWSTFQPCQESTFTRAVTESRTRASNT
jgi:hypothetical protein